MPTIAKNVKKAKQAERDKIAKNNTIAKNVTVYPDLQKCHACRDCRDY